MKLIPLGANKTELRLGNVDDGCMIHDVRVLFSYETPVAYSCLTASGRLFFRTNERYSATTRHIKSWLPWDNAEEVDQYMINDVVNNDGH